MVGVEQFPVGEFITKRRWKEDAQSTVCRLKCLLFDSQEIPFASIGCFDYEGFTAQWQNFYSFKEWPECSLFCVNAVLTVNREIDKKIQIYAVSESQLPQAQDSLLVKASEVDLAPSDEC